MPSLASHLPLFLIVPGHLALCHALAAPALAVMAVPRPHRCRCRRGSGRGWCGNLHTEEISSHPMVSAEPVALGLDGRRGSAARDRI
jgi:hypothetical protein